MVADNNMKIHIATICLSRPKASKVIDGYKKNKETHIYNKNFLFYSRLQNINLHEFTWLMKTR